MASNFMLAPGETFVQCPYNMSHLIINKKFMTHLVKCRQSYLADLQRQGIKPEMTECRYNWSHQFHKDEIREHEENCEDRYTVVPFIRDELRQRENAGRNACAVDNELADMTENLKLEGDKFGTRASDLGDENWDEECSDGYQYQYAYNPRAKLENSDEVYYVNLPGLKPAERKKFREENRLKELRKLEKDEQNGSIVPKAPIPYDYQYSQAAANSQFMLKCKRESDEEFMEVQREDSAEIGVAPHVSDEDYDWSEN